MLNLLKYSDPLVHFVGEALEEDGGGGHLGFGCVKAVGEMFFVGQVEPHDPAMRLLTIIQRMHCI